ncbi:hypothetical protein Catovirus_2_204 [Catovirus CTV1]|uniref:Uncharacterized protein n=1 Tax=Catovirus CTV1 TaxID=1977631 RepID=A0A1V0SC16_9VIRU|nr:hypothetical protein Catovirus_2_204 [Catovirus CTV1]
MFNYNGISSNSSMNNGLYNFDKSYSKSKQLIDKTDFSNKGNLVHNNVADNMLLERVTEYQINIDSNDRKISVYPNPFKFTVIFGGIGPQQLNSRNGNKKYDDEDNSYFEGSPAPVIDRKFKNVKYVKIDFIMLPKTVMLFEQNNKYDFEHSDRCTHLTSYGYLILKINELSSGRILGTNTLLTDNSFVLYPDKSMGPDYVMWVTSNGSRIYNNSNLGNLDKLTFSILTPSGKQLHFIDSKQKEIDFSVLYKQSKRGEENSICLKKVLEKLKCYISVIVGVVENEINTNTKYES